jgi:hypothetical protein
MSDDDATSTPAPSRKRRLIAAALSPLVGAAAMVPLLWGESTHMMADHSAAAALRASAGAGLWMAYGLAVPVIPVAWLIMIWTKAPHRAWTIVSVFVAAFAIAGFAVGGDIIGGIVLGVLLGLPTAITYSLLVGASWRNPPPDTVPR